MSMLGKLFGKRGLQGTRRTNQQTDVEGYRPVLTTTVKHDDNEVHQATTVDCGLHQGEGAKHVVIAILKEGHLKGFSGMCDVGAAEAMYRLGTMSCYGFFNAWITAAKGGRGRFRTQNEEEALEKLHGFTTEIRNNRLNNKPWIPGRLELSGNAAAAFIEKSIPENARVAAGHARGGHKVTVPGDPPSSYHLMTDTLSWALGSGPGHPDVIKYLQKLSTRVLDALVHGPYTHKDT